MVFLRRDPEQAHQLANIAKNLSTFLHLSEISPSVDSYSSSSKCKKSLEAFSQGYPEKLSMEVFPISLMIKSCLTFPSLNSINSHRHAKKVHFFHCRHFFHSFVAPVPKKSIYKHSIFLGISMHSYRTLDERCSFVFCIIHRWHKTIVLCLHTHWHTRLQISSAFNLNTTMATL